MKTFGRHPAINPFHSATIERKYLSIATLCILNDGTITARRESRKVEERVKEVSSAINREVSVALDSLFSVGHVAAMLLVALAAVLITAFSTTLSFWPYILSRDGLCAPVMPGTLLKAGDDYSNKGP